MKNTILKLVSWGAYLVLMFCFCCIDTPNIRPLIIPMVICGGWLALFVYANCVWEGKRKDGK